MDKYIRDGDTLIINEGVEELDYEDFHIGYTDMERFQQIKPEFQEIKEIHTPRSLKRIYNAFEDFRNLKKVVLAEGLEAIGSAAFLRCENLKSITFPSTLKKIGRLAFGSCYSLEKVCLGENLRHIGNGAFIACSSLSTLLINNGIEAFGDKYDETFGDDYGVFENCIGLKKLSLPESVISLQPCMFRDCENLESVKLPNGLKILPHYLFHGCKNLKYVNIPEEIEEVEYGVFHGLRNTVIDAKTKNDAKFSKEAFQDCSGITLNYKGLYGPSQTKIGKNTIAFLSYDKYGFSFQIHPFYKTLQKIKNVDLKIFLATFWGFPEHPEQKQFQDYLKRVSYQAVRYAIDFNDMFALDYLIDNKLIGLKNINKEIDYAGLKGRTEMYAMLLQYKKEMGGYDKDYIKGKFDL